MSGPVFALRRAMRRALAADPELVRLTGSIHDHPPATARFPYLTFGEASCDDWSTDGCAGAEVLLTVHAWSRADGSREALGICERVRGILHEGALALEGCRLVSLRVAASAHDYIHSARAHHAALQLRALIEID